MQGWNKKQKGLLWITPGFEKKTNKEKALKIKVQYDDENCLKQYFHNYLYSLRHW